MTKFIFCLFGFFFFVAGRSQLVVQSGAALSIEPGARVFVQGDFSNTSGTLTNNGTLEVQGSFTNAGTYTSTSNDDSLLLTGEGEFKLNGGSSILNYLQINKTNNGAVTLAGNTTIGTKFDFLAGTFSTDPATTFELIAPATATFSFANGKEIVGKVRRTAWANGSSVAFNQTNMKLATNGGTAPTAILVNMVPAGNPTGSEREVKRTFNFTATGGIGYTADVTFPYNASEVNTNTQANLAPWYLQSSEWNAKLTGNTVNTASHFVTTTAIPAAVFGNTEWKLADPVYTFNVNAILRGAWNSGTGLMNTNLNTAGLIPLSQPYNIANFNYEGIEAVSAIPANVVDWVLLELRKPASGLPGDATSSTIIGRKAVFLLNNGALADLNGTPIPLVTISKQGASFIVVRHRNHLAVMSNSIPSNAAGTFANNFGLSANAYKKPGASSDPEIPLPSSTLYGLWPGDANRNNSVNSIDVSSVKAAIAVLSSGYKFPDINLNGAINSIDLNLLKVSISVLGSSSAANRSVNSTQPNVITTQVPE